MIIASKDNCNITMKTTVATPIVVNDYVPSLTVHITEPHTSYEYLKIVGRGRVGKLTVTMGDTIAHLNLDLSLDKVTILNAPSLKSVFFIKDKYPNLIYSVNDDVSNHIYVNGCYILPKENVYITKDMQIHKLSDAINFEEDISKTLKQLIGMCI